MTEGKGAVLYKITNTVNGKCYVGVTTDFRRRMSKHRSCPNTKMKEDVKLHGWESFTKEILVRGLEDYCYSIEDAIIIAYNAVYNTVAGGRWHVNYVGEEHPNSKLIEKDILKIRSMYSEGTNSMSELGVIFKVQTSTIGNIIQGKAWAHVEEGISTDNTTKIANKGSKHPNTKLTDKDIISIREIYAEGLAKTSDLVALYNIQKAAIGKILDGKTWAHLSGPIRGIDYPNVFNNKQSGNWPKENIDGS